MDTNTVIAARIDEYFSDKAIIIESSVIKRASDLLIAAAVSVTLLPILYVVVGLLIKLTSGGAIIFKQTRVGKDGELFCIYKFRTMYSDPATGIKKTILPGRYMRTTHIDELPQMINVLKGDMSIVGPRPHTIDDTERFSRNYTGYAIRLTVKPGITGLAQANGYCGNIENIYQLRQRIDADILYIRSWNLFSDAIILIRTAITNIAKCLGLF